MQLQVTMDMLPSEVKTLDLSSNKMRDLPVAIGRLSKLKTLDLSNNPFKDNRFKKLANDKRQKVEISLLFTWLQS